MNQRNKILVAVLCFCSTLGASAQMSEKIETDRPNETETPYTTPHRWFQAEAGFRGEDRFPNGSTVFIPTLVSKYGLSDRVELRLITELVKERDYFYRSGDPMVSYLKPVRVGAKIRLCEEKGWRPKTSFIAQSAVTRSSARAFREERWWAPELRMAMQHDLAKWFNLGYNVGIEWEQEGGNPSWLYTFAPGFNLGEKWYVFVESYAFFRKGNHPHFNYDAGLAYDLSKHARIDLSSGFGVGNSDLDEFVSLGFSFRVPTQK